MIIQRQQLSHQSKHKTAWHQHDTGQFFCIRSGMMIVQTEQAQWALTPSSVGWFPPRLRHCAWTVGDVEGESLPLSACGSDALPQRPGVWPADPFLLLLMDKIGTLQPTAASASRVQHLLTVMMDEIRHASPAPLQLVLPEDRRARRVAEQLLLQLNSTTSQQALASTNGLSVRTLSRLFSEQTGLSFSQWRQQARILASIGWLLRGASVSETATQCGYDNVSAFIAAFKLRFGMTPGAFRLHNYNERESGRL